MKYARLGPRKDIVMVVDDTDRPGMDTTDLVPLTDEQVAAVTDIRANKQIPVWFGDAVTSRELQYQAGQQMRWDEEAGDFKLVPRVPQPPIPGLPASETPLVKYARLGPRKDIVMVVDAARPGMDTAGLIQLTAEQVAAVTDIRANKQIPVWFGDAVTSRELQYQAGQQMRWDEEAGDFKLVSIPPVLPRQPRPEPVRTISKLAIRRQLRLWGVEATFDAVLDSIPHARTDWDDCQEIYTDDPLFSAHKDALKAALGLSDEQFDDLLKL